jgi:hypothetical protein
MSIQYFFVTVLKQEFIKLKLIGSGFYQSPQLVPYIRWCCSRLLDHRLSPVLAGPLAFFSGHSFENCVPIKIKLYGFCSHFEIFVSLKYIILRQWQLVCDSNWEACVTCKGIDPGSGSCSRLLLDAKHSRSWTQTIQDMALYQHVEVCPWYWSTFGTFSSGNWDYQDNWDK